MKITDDNLPAIKSHAGAISDYAVVLMYTDRHHPMFEDRQARLIERLEAMLKDLGVKS